MEFRTFQRIFIRMFSNVRGVAALAQFLPLSSSFSVLIIEHLSTVFALDTYTAVSYTMQKESQERMQEFSGLL